MNRANQQALFQLTNIRILNIRQLEINYYLNLHSAFGTQAALIGGFTYGTFSQNTLNTSAKYMYIYEFFYFLLISITIACSVHVILCTMLLLVYGPGLALNGPIGSMSKAAAGMRAEQDQIIMSFVFMMCAFVLSSVWAFWMIMEVYVAMTSTIVIVIASRFWYYYFERIYLRFYWNKEEALWNDIDTGRLSNEDGPLGLVGSSSTTNPPAKVNALSSAPKSLFRAMFYESNTKNNSEDVSTSTTGEEHNSKSNHNRTNPSTLFSYLASWKRPDNHDISSVTYPRTDNNIAPITTARSIAATATTTGVIMEGYTTIRCITKQQLLSVEASSHSNSSNNKYNRLWERRYIVLHGTGHLFLYKTRQAYRSNPKTPIYTRPLKLAEFRVQIQNTDLDKRVLEQSQKQQQQEEEEEEELQRQHNLDDLNNQGDARSDVYSITPPTSSLPSLSDKRNIPSHQQQQEFLLLFQLTLFPMEEEDDEQLQLESEYVTKNYHHQPQQQQHLWQLRFDSEEELDIWIEVMRNIIPDSFN